MDPVAILFEIVFNRLTRRFPERFRRLVIFSFFAALLLLIISGAVLLGWNNVE